jgi:hypothetical protein
MEGFLIIDYFDNDFLKKNENNLKNKNKFIDMLFPLVIKTNF